MTRPAGPIRLGRWRPAPPSLEEHVEAGSVRVGDSVYVIGGYQTLTRMSTRMQILDVAAGRWRYGPALPEGFPLSHAGVATDGRFVFVVSGQPGPACQPATSKAWVLDVRAMTWSPMSPLPAARYAPVLEYVDGSLHLISGAAEDRETISTDHWVMRVRDRNADPASVPNVTAAWSRGPAIPIGGDHAASVVLEGRIYVVGGEHGHARLTMDPAQCCGTYWGHDYLFRYDPAHQTWERLADLPVPTSHQEHQTIAVNDRILVLGGTGDRDVFVREVQEYDPAADRWRRLRSLPVARKGGVVWSHDGVVYFNGGQIMPDKRRPMERSVVTDTMAAKLKRDLWSAFRRARNGRLPAAR